MKTGRPTKMTDSTVHKLEDGFSRGFSDLEACVYAGITKQTLYNYTEKNPEFLDRKEFLKNTPLMKAKHNVTDALDEGDKDMSKWYLERKAKAEFSTKQEIEHSGELDINVNTLSPEEAKKHLKELLGGE